MEKNDNFTIDMKILNTIGEGVTEEDSQEGVSLVPVDAVITNTTSKIGEGTSQKDLQLADGDENSSRIASDKQEQGPLSA